MEKQETKMKYLTIEQAVGKSKDLSDFVNNYTGMNSNEFGQELYQRGRSYLIRKNVERVFAGMGVGALCTLVAAYGLHEQKPALAMTGAFAGAFAGLYTLIRAMITMDFYFNPEELSKEAKEYARTVIKKRIGAKQ